MSVELRNVSFAYPDGSVAVEEVSLEIGEGERLAIIGQNGAGKTTTVKMMNGLLKPTSGEVFVDGVSTAHRSTASVARDVGYVFQNPDDQISASTVLAELEYMPRYLKWDEDLTSKRVQRALKLTGIGRFLDTNPNDLPFAVKKFVAIAATLIGERRYLVLDEPTAGLDANGIAFLNVLIDHLGTEGISVITISHDMRFVVENFDRVVVMANRRVLADGAAADVFADDAVLESARLRRPEVAQLARDLGLGNGALRLEQVAAAIP